MSHNLINKKRNILQHLNVHLQVQAVKLGHVDAETNILPNNTYIKSDDKPMRSLRTNVVPISNNGIICKRNNLPKQKARKLRPYDPLYTWNRGGRVKELRIRCQARKYFHIWKMKSLGRVTKIEAEKFYRVQLIKRCWTIWYEQHWQLRVEPRLLGRAILYRKSILIRSTFLAWQWWTKLRAFRRVKMDIAVKYNDIHLKKYAISCWLSWIFVRKCKMKLRALSDNWRKENLLTHYLAVWRTQLVIQRDSNAKMTIAIRHDYTVVLSKAWQQWIEVRPDLRRDKLANMKASSYHGNMLLRKSVKHWIEYHHKCRMKSKELDKWRDHYQWNLAHRFMKRWREQYIRSLTLSVVDIRISDLARRFQVRRVVVAWKYHVMRVEEKKKSVAKAANFYELSLKRKTILSMTRFCAMERTNADLRIRGREFNDRITLRRYLTKWLEMLDHKDDLSRMVELGAARAHYRRTLFLKCFRHFSDFIDQSNVIKERRKIADDFRRDRVLRRGVAGWLQQVGVLKHKKEILKIKDDYLKNGRTRRIWHVWNTRTNERLTAKNNLTEFVNRRIVRDKIRLLDAWRTLTNREMRKKNNNDKAAVHYQENLLRKCLMVMNRFVQEKIERKCLNQMANNHFNNRIICNCFNALRDYNAAMARERTILSDHIAAKERRIKGMIFGSWRILVEERRSIIVTVDNLYAQKIKETLYKRFMHWRRIVRIHKNKRRESAKVVGTAKEILNANIARRTLCFWNERALARCHQSNKCVLAEDFHRLRLVAQYFAVWRRYREEQRTNASMRELSSWYWRKSQLTQTWLSWSRAMVDRQREEYYTKFALAHWAVKLQERVFHAWIRYKVDYKQKRDDENEAFAVFQRRVTRYTLGQWLRSGDFLYQWRQSQNRGGYNRTTVVSRAFDHWRQWTLCRITRSRVITDTAPRPCTDVQRPTIRFNEHKTFKTIKERPAPKIPDFLLRPLEHARIPEKRKDNHNCTKKEDDLQDDALLAPASFRVPIRLDNQEDDRNQAQGSLMEELNHIKERLKNFKETKESLRKLRAEVYDYDRVLSQLSVNNTSFYQEFNPLEHRDELVIHIKEMEQTLADELPICNNLMKRAQTLMTVCRNN